MKTLKAVDAKGNEYPKMNYLFYSMREAKNRYRDQHDLKNKRLQWL